MISAISDVRVSTLSSDKHSSFGLESEPKSTSTFSSLSELVSELVSVLPPHEESNKNKNKTIEKYYFTKLILL